MEQKAQARANLMLKKPISPEKIRAKATKMLTLLSFFSSKRKSILGVGRSLTHGANPKALSKAKIGTAKMVPKNSPPEILSLFGILPSII